MHDKRVLSCRDYLSPLKLTLLVINAVCLGGCIVLLSIGSAGGPLVLLTVGLVLSLFAGLTGAIIAYRRIIHKDSDGLEPGAGMNRGTR